MLYIDKLYYDNEYKGTPLTDSTEFSRLEKRASEVIDMVTKHTIANYEFTQLATFIQEQVKMATAAQVEYYVLNGGYEDVNGLNLQSVRLGNFSMNQQEIENKQVSSTAIEYLKPTGLLYSGIGVRS